VKDGDRPPDLFLLGSCADTQALADERPAGILFVSEAVFAGEHLMQGMQGWFLCFRRMFEICLLLRHLQSLLEGFEFASLWSACWATGDKWLSLRWSGLSLLAREEEKPTA